KLSPSKATDAVVTFKSSKPSVLQVDKAGRLTALKMGKAKLTLKAGGKTATATVTVVAPVARVVLEGAPKSLKVGKKVALEPDFVWRGLGGNYKPKLSWTSSNKEIATVSSKGVVKAKKPGKVKITVKTCNGKKATVKITVKK
ncbi:MAG: Ig domain-containing protein, partial [Oscillospiraceae bacterium]